MMKRDMMMRDMVKRDMMVRDKMKHDIMWVTADGRTLSPVPPS
jgi:hypothetical protein